MGSFGAEYISWGTCGDSRMGVKDAGWIAWTGLAGRRAPGSPTVMNHLDPSGLIPPDGVAEDVNFDGVHQPGRQRERGTPAALHRLSASGDSILRRRDAAPWDTEAETSPALLALDLNPRSDDAVAPRQPC